MLTLIAIAATAPLHGQVYEANTIKAVDEIVRDIDGTRSIIYAFDVVDSTGFFALDNGVGNLLYFYMPRKTRVRDVETDGTYVYFCGEANGFGMVGLFNWHDVFYASGQIDIIPCTSVSNGTHYIHVTEYTKMDFFPGGARPIFALVGTSVMDEYELLSRTVISSAQQTSPSQWSFQHLYNKDGEITYTDIAALGDAVAAVGSRANNGCYWKAFHQGANFLSSPLNTVFATEIKHTRAEGPSLIVRTGHNRAAVVHHGDGYLTSHYLEEDLATESPFPYEHSFRLLPQSSLPYSNNWEINDLRHDEKLFVLDHADHDSSGNILPWVIELPETSPLPTTHAKTKFTFNPQSLSINSISKLPFLSGFSTPQLFLSSKFPFFIDSPSRCEKHTLLTPVYGVTRFEDILINIDHSTFFVPIITSTPVILEEQRTIKCN